MADLYIGGKQLDYHYQIAMNQLFTCLYLLSSLS